MFLRIRLPACVLLWCVLVVCPAADADPCARWLAQARDTLALVERSAPQPALAARLAALEAETKARPDPALVPRIRALRREIILAHPALAFDDLVFTEHPLARNQHMGDCKFGRVSATGAGLVRLNAWKTAPTPIYLTRDRLPMGTVEDPDISFDGQRAVFAFCDHAAAGPQTWKRAFHLYEIALDGSGLRQITGTGSDPLATRWGRDTQMIEDFMPLYLPDGGFVFSSTRNQVTVRCAANSRYNPSFVLYRCSRDGSDIRPMSYGELDEYPSAVMPDGRVLYTRWEYINRDITVLHGLWTTRTDGTGVRHVYGNSTIDPDLIIEGRTIPGSSKIVANASSHHNRRQGSIVLVDPAAGEDGYRPLTHITPEVAFPEAQTNSFLKLKQPILADGNGVYTFGLTYPLNDPSPMAVVPRPVEDGHRDYMHPYALSEDLFLVSHVGPGTDGRFGIWLVDRLGGRELIYVPPGGDGAFKPMPVLARELPHSFPQPPPQVADDRAATGVISIANVYNNRFDKVGRIAPGTVKWLRVNQIGDQPTTVAKAISRVVFETPKRVVGIAPVEADGSVTLRAPAGVPLQFQLLDEHKMTVMGMRSFVYLQPNETMSCIGCHESRESAPPTNRPRAQGAVRTLQAEAWEGHPAGFSFPRVVQPVFDRTCISCHGLGDGTAVSLLGTREVRGYATNGITSNWPGKIWVDASTAYLNLLEQPKVVAIAQAYHETSSSLPYDYYAHAGTLVAMLRKGHHGVVLSEDDYLRITDWLDLNAQYASSYSWNRAEFNRVSPEGEQQLRAFLRGRLPVLADQPLAALVNTTAPEESRVLKAPLAVAAGGWGQVAGGWTATTDGEYRHLVELVRATVSVSPFHDIAGTCGRGTVLPGPNGGPQEKGGSMEAMDAFLPGRCVCGSCSQRLFNESLRAKR